MRRLPVPDRGDDRENIINNVREYRYNGEERGYNPSDMEVDDIIDVYDRYDRLKGRFDSSLIGKCDEDLDDALVAAIQGAYSKTYSGNPLHALRKRLLKNVNSCPICGINEAEQLDHFLPKSQFGVLSIYPRNLIPVCASCNKKKLASADPDPSKQLVHAYLDPIPDTKFLNAEVVISGDALLVTIIVDPTVDLPGDLAHRIEFQLQTLELDKKYDREINLYVGGHTVACHTLFHSGGAEAVVQFLETQATQDERRCGVNNWRPVVMWALSESNEFCDGGFKNIFPLL